MAIAGDDGGELIVGDVTKTGGRALAVGLSQDEHGPRVSVGWVEQGERLELSLDEAGALRDELSRIIADAGSLDARS